jgi:hypothetical protein
MTQISIDETVRGAIVAFASDPNNHVRQVRESPTVTGYRVIYSLVSSTKKISPKVSAAKCGTSFPEKDVNGREVLVILIPPPSQKPANYGALGEKIYGR